MKELKNHPFSHIIDNRFHGGGFATDESRAIFSDVIRLQRWLVIEAELALAQAELGIIPEIAAKEIAGNCKLELLDLAEIQERIQLTNHSLVPLLEQVESRCGEDHGQFIHFGATTQDIQDSGTALEMKAVISLVERDLQEVVAVLDGMIDAHRDTVMIARTHAMPAMPFTLAVKLAGWKDELRRHQERIQQLKSRVLVVELGGAVGTLAAIGEKGQEVVELLAKKLGLGVPAMCWHSSRDRMTEYVTTLALITTSLGRFCDEIRISCRPEVGEMSEPWELGMIGSSTMPHKRNPEVTEQVVALARLCASQAGASYHFMLQDNERDYRGTRMEWPVFGDVSHFTLCALSLSKFVLSGLVIHKEKMAYNVAKFSADLCSEALMFALAPHIGKQVAHELVYDLVHEAIEGKETLEEISRSHDKVVKHLTEEELSNIFDPTNQIGQSMDISERIRRS